MYSLAIGKLGTIKDTVCVCMCVCVCVCVCVCACVCVCVHACVRATVLTALGSGGSSLLQRLLRYQVDRALQTGSGRSSKSRCCAKITSDLRRPPSFVRLIS